MGVYCAHFNITGMAKCIFIYKSLTPSPESHKSEKSITKSMTKKQTCLYVTFSSLAPICTATGDLLHTIHPFVSKINNVSFPSTNADIFLVTTNTDAIIFNSHNFQQKHRLEYPAAEFTIKQMNFLNKSDQIYSIFSNDTIHIWTHENFHLVERIHPIHVRESFLKNSKPQRIDLNANTDDNNVLLWNLTKDYTKGLISDVCFSDEHMCVATIDDYLMVFDTATWNLMKLIHSPGIAVFRIHFVTTSDVPDKMLISLVTVAKDTILFDLNNLSEKLCVQADHTLTVAFTENSALMAILLRTGEIKMFDSKVLIEKLQTLQGRTNCDDGSCQQQWNWINEKVKTKYLFSIPKDKPLP